MAFLDKYELLEVISDEDTRTFKARQASSGRMVLVHQLSGGRTHTDQIDLIRMVVRYIRNASPQSLSRVLDMEEHKGSVYLVTELLPEFRTVRSWLESEIKKQEASSSAGLELGRFARSAESHGPMGTIVEAPSQPVSAEPPPAVSKEPGEFTKMLQSPEADSPGGMRTEQAKEIRTDTRRRRRRLSLGAWRCY